MKAIALITAALAFTAAAAQAAQPPSAEEVRRVLDYYYGASTGAPVLVDFKLCTDVHREGADKYNCKHEIGLDELEVGDNVYAWMNFMVPREERGDVLLQMRHDGVIRGARKAGVEGAIRYRTWRRISFARAGEWQLPILYDNQDLVREIDTVTLTVHEPLMTQLFRPEDTIADGTD